MNKIETFKEFITTQNINVPIFGFIFNLILAAVLSFVLSRIYVKYGRSLSNRQAFSMNFVPVTMTTMLIITIVKSSLALSLGLVGALSIVRFRTAIKEPEELSYLFLSISVGLGLGANQRLLTVVGLIGIVGIVYIIGLFHKSGENQNLCLTISSHNPREICLEQIVETLKKYCVGVDLKRFDEANEILEVSFLVEYNDFKQFIESKTAIQNLNDSIRITFMDNKGIL